MSIFSNILSRIFPAHHPAVAAQTATTPAPASPAASQPTASAGGTASSPAPASVGTTPASAGTRAAGAGAQPVDVEAVLNGLAAKNAEKLNWRTSIVDLMKLLGLDSSLAARKSLAQELHYTGDTNDSAAMNMWLQKQVMRKLAENGGKVPEDLKH